MAGSELGINNNWGSYNFDASKAFSPGLLIEGPDLTKPEFVEDKFKPFIDGKKDEKEILDAFYKSDKYTTKDEASSKGNLTEAEKQKNLQNFEALVAHVAKQNPELAQKLLAQANQNITDTKISYHDSDLVDQGLGSQIREIQNRQNLYSDSERAKFTSTPGNLNFVNNKALGAGKEYRTKVEAHIKTKGLTGDKAEEFRRTALFGVLGDESIIDVSKLGISDEDKPNFVKGFFANGSETEASNFWSASMGEKYTDAITKRLAEEHGVLITKDGKVSGTGSERISAKTGQKFTAQDVENRKVLNNLDQEIGNALTGVKDPAKKKEAVQNLLNNGKDKLSKLDIADLNTVLNKHGFGAYAIERMDTKGNKTTELKAFSGTADTFKELEKAGVKNGDIGKAIQDGTLVPADVQDPGLKNAIKEFLFDKVADEHKHAKEKITENEKYLEDATIQKASKEKELKDTSAKLSQAKAAKADAKREVESLEKSLRAEVDKALANSLHKSGAEAIAEQAAEEGFSKEEEKVNSKNLSQRLSEFDEKIDSYLHNRGITDPGEQALFRQQAYESFFNNKNVQNIIDKETTINSLNNYFNSRGLNVEKNADGDYVLKGYAKDLDKLNTQISGVIILPSRPGIKTKGDILSPAKSSTIAHVFAQLKSSNETLEKKSTEANGYEVEETNLRTDIKKLDREVTDARNAVDEWKTEKDKIESSRIFELYKTERESSSSSSGATTRVSAARPLTDPELKELMKLTTEPGSRKIIGIRPRVKTALNENIKSQKVLNDEQVNLDNINAAAPFRNPRYDLGSKDGKENINKFVEEITTTYPDIKSAKDREGIMQKMQEAKLDVEQRRYVMQQLANREIRVRGANGRAYGEGEGFWGTIKGYIPNPVSFFTGTDDVQDHLDGDEASVRAYRELLGQNGFEMMVDPSTDKYIVVGDGKSLKHYGNTDGFKDPYLRGPDNVSDLIAKNQIKEIHKNIAEAQAQAQAMGPAREKLWLGIFGAFSQWSVGMAGSSASIVEARQGGRSNLSRVRGSSLDQQYYQPRPIGSY